MVSIINVHIGHCGYQNCNTSQNLIFDEYFKAREFLYTHVIIWMSTILNHIDIAMYPCVKVLAWYINPNGIENKYILKYSYHNGTKMWNPHCRYISK